MRWLRPIALVTALLLGPAAANDSANPPVKGAVEHRVVRGDTLGTLSRCYGPPPEVLRNFTGGGPPKVGSVIWIPPPKNGWVVHRVIPNQTLESIAQGYGVPAEQVRQANSLQTDELSPGQQVLIPRARKPEWTAAAEPTEQPQTPKKPEGITASRSARPTLRSPLAAKPVPKPAPQPVAKPPGKWTLVTLADGRKGWVRVDELEFEDPNRSLPSSFSFGQKLSRNQKEAILELVASLEQDGFQVKADDIINFMALETGGTFDPGIRNSKVKNGPVGLCQFTSVAIQDLNQRRPPHDQLSRERLASMTFEEQCEVVADYLSTAFQRKNLQGKEVCAADLYSAIFAPKAIGLPLEATIYSEETDRGAYSRNRSLDHDRDGQITKAEMVKRLEDWARRGEALRG